MNTEFEIQPPIKSELEFSPVETLSSDLTVLRSELTEPKETGLRAIADFEYFKTRLRQKGETRVVAQTESFVFDVLQRGYRQGEKIFRRAKVVVNNRTQP